MLNKRLLRSLTLVITFIVVLALVSFYNAPNYVVQTLKDMALSDTQDVLIHIGFTTCYSFAFFETCRDGIKKALDDFPSNIRDSVKIIHSDKNLVPDAHFTTIYPYEITLPYDIVVSHQIDPITKFYIYNKNTGTGGIPNDILDNENVEITKNLQQLGYYNPGYGLFYRRSPSFSFSNLFSKVNFLHFSGEHPIPSWKKVSDYPLVIDTDSSEGALRDISDYKTRNHHKYDHEMYVYVKQNLKDDLPEIKLKPNSDKSFKILQLADLHLSTGYGYCEDVFPKIDYDNKNCLADVLTLDLIEKVLDIENPDLVVFSGDQIYGKYSYDAESTIYKMVEGLVERRIPYAVVFGNHDDEDTTSRKEQMAIYENLPYSLSKAGPEEIDGVGNYVLSIGDEFDIYMLDSHTKLGVDIRGYDWFKESQIEYVSQVAKDRPEIAKMAFFHIPLFEYRDAHDLVGSWREGVISGRQTTNMLPTMKKAGVKLISVGHDHVNDYCFLNDGVELCYGGGGGYGGYGGYGGFIRRVRIFELDLSKDNRGRLVGKTWKRAHDNIEEIIDYQELNL